jgi:hypothetical protein
MNLGDSFFDVTSGNITISGVEQRTYADTERTVLTASTAQTTFYWDKATGILVEAHSSYTNPDFTMVTVADKTNMWHPQIMGLDQDVFYSIVVAAIVIVIMIVVAVIALRRKPS